MARKEALLRLHQQLISKRDGLRKRLRDDCLELSGTHDVGDVGDAANDGERSEIDSQIAAFETRELHQIEKAIEMIREGRYGTCDLCDRSIPIERLRALPYTPLCIDCQRKLEDQGRSMEDFDVNWEGAYDFEGRMSDRELTLGDIDIEA